MIRVLILLCCCILLLGCSNVYHYNNVDETFEVYWSETKGLLSTNTNNIHVKYPDSNNVAIFEERDGKVVFRKRMNDIGDQFGICGIIHDVESISDIDDSLTLSIWCQNKHNPFNVGRHDYPLFLTPTKVEIIQTKQ